MTQYSLMAGKGVVADFDRNGVDDFIQGLDFNEISSVFDRYKPNAPILSVEDGTYYITIGELKMRVVSTQGGTGEWKQRYLLQGEIARSRSESLRYLQQGGDNRFRVYGRAGERCARCKAEISKFVQGGRSTYYCPRCQPKRK